MISNAGKLPSRSMITVSGLGHSSARVESSVVDGVRDIVEMIIEKMAPFWIAGVFDPFASAQMHRLDMVQRGTPERLPGVVAGIGAIGEQVVEIQQQVA